MDGVKKVAANEVRAGAQLRMQVYVFLKLGIVIVKLCLYSYALARVCKEKELEEIISMKQNALLFALLFMLCVSST